MIFLLQELFELYHNNILLYLTSFLNIFIEIITFISNFINLTEVQPYYMKDFNYFQNIKKNENFQIIINNYILKDYFIFNNLNNVNFIKVILFNEQQLYLFFQSIFSKLEIFLIIIQKIIYDYADYTKSLFV
jgi:hypothetical protein